MGFKKIIKMKEMRKMDRKGAKFMEIVKSSNKGVLVNQCSTGTGGNDFQAYNFSIEIWIPVKINPILHGVDPGIYLHFWCSWSFPTPPSSAHRQVDGTPSCGTSPQQSSDTSHPANVLFIYLFIYLKNSDRKNGVQAHRI
jgi:hypothetical protein